MTENFPELGKEISVHPQEACGTPTGKSRIPSLTRYTHRTHTAGSKEGLRDKRKQCQPRAAPAKLSVITRGKTKALHDKNSLKEFMATKPALRNTLEGILKLRKKTKPSMKLKERINHTKLIVKQDKKEKPNTTKINKMAGTNAHPSTMAKSSVSVSQSKDTVD